MLQKDTPDHHDGELVIRLYELRREPVMRESRATILSKYWPASEEEATAVAKAEHPMNAAYRQVAQLLAGREVDLGAGDVFLGDDIAIV